MAMQIGWAISLLEMSGLGASWRYAAALVLGSLHPLRGGGCAWAGQSCSLQHEHFSGSRLSGCLNLLPERF